jgi:hypothetical protein
MTGVGEAFELTKEYLASPNGRRARATLATAMIAAAPLVMRMPVVRAHPLGRLIAFAGGAAAVIRAAELLRDWEPAVAQPVEGDRS